MKFDLNNLGWRDRVQLGAVVMSLLGIATMLGGAAIPPVLTRFGPAVTMVDHVRVLEADALFGIMHPAGAVSSTGFAMMAGGAMLWSVLFPSRSLMSIWSRASSFLLWGAMLVLLFGFRGMSLAQIGVTVLGKMAYGVLGLCFVSLALQLIAESILRARLRGVSHLA